MSCDQLREKKEISRLFLFFYHQSEMKLLSISHWVFERKEEKRRKMKCCNHQFHFHFNSNKVQKNNNEMNWGKGGEKRKINNGKSRMPCLVEEDKINVALAWCNKVEFFNRSSIVAWFIFYKILFSIFLILLNLENEGEVIEVWR